MTSAGPATKSPAGGERLAERSDAQIDAVFDAEQLGGPRAAAAQDAGAMGLVDQQARAEALGQVADLGAAARSPSIEKTPSTTRGPRRRPRLARSSERSSLSIRLWRNARSLARDSRQPSRIDA